MKKVFLILLIFLQFSVSAGSSSIRPILITSLPKTLSIGLNEVNLTWYVIDDNPECYYVYINDQIWKNNISLLSNEISFTFSDVVGNYTIKLIVFDYSGYSITSSINISVIAVSSNSSNTNTNVSSSTTMASPGFTSFEVLIILLGCAAYLKKIKIHHKKKKM